MSNAICQVCGVRATSTKTRAGWCQPCYSAAVRDGGLPPLHRPSAVERFWDKVNKDGPTMPHMETPCWVWTAAFTQHGYGRILWDGRVERASRVSWSLRFGAIPDGLFVLHHCDNPPCVRPDHLFLGTKKDNAMDMWAKGRGHQAPTLLGEQHGRAKLTWGDVKRIRSGAGPDAKIARELGVTTAAVRHARVGITWRRAG